MSAEQHASVDGGRFDLSAFVRGLTHEIANPLNAVAINCDLLKMVVDRGDMTRAREVLARLGTASATCAAMMRSLQAFGSALRRSEPVRVAVADVFHGAVQAFVLRHSGERPEIDVASSDGHVHVDHPAFQQALVALLKNAAEAGARRVVLDARRERSSIVLTLRDDGEGFRGDDAARRETPFYSTHRSPANMGLGLTLAREVLRMNDGTLRIVAVEQGAQIELRVPEAV